MLKRLLLTGAAGGLARGIRPLLSELAEQAVLSDLTEIDDPGANQSFVRCDLSDAAAVAKLVEGVDGIIHLGGVSIEKPFDMTAFGSVIDEQLKLAPAA